MLYTFCPPTSRTISGKVVKSLVDKMYRVSTQNQGEGVLGAQKNKGEGVLEARKKNQGGCA